MRRRVEALFALKNSREDHLRQTIPGSKCPYSTQVNSHSPNGVASASLLDPLFSFRSAEASETKMPSDLPIHTLPAASRWTVSGDRSPVSASRQSPPILAASAKNLQFGALPNTGRFNHYLVAKKIARHGFCVEKRPPLCPAPPVQASKVHPPRTRHQAPLSEYAAVWCQHSLWV